MPPSTGLQCSQVPRSAFYKTAPRAKPDLLESLSCKATDKNKNWQNGKDFFGRKKSPYDDYCHHMMMIIIMSTAISVANIMKSVWVYSDRVCFWKHHHHHHIRITMIITIIVWLWCIDEHGHQCCNHHEYRDSADSGKATTCAHALLNRQAGWSCHDDDDDDAPTFYCEWKKITNQIRWLWI